jgi:hypothetical protein
VRSTEATDALKHKNTQCSGDIRKYPRGSKFEYFLKQFPWLVIELKSSQNMSFEEDDLIAKISLNVYIL